MEHALAVTPTDRRGSAERASTRRNAAPTQESARYQTKIVQAQERDSSSGRRCCRLLEYVCRRWAESTIFSALITVLTIYALFGDDIRLLFTSKPSDFIFDVITVACMCIFSLEIIVCCVGKAEYLFGFFFWLDIMSTMTLLLDVTTISEDLFGDSISSLGEGTQGGGGGGSAGDSAEAARAARMSRAGTKAGRVVRLIRLMRLLRLFKSFKKETSHYHSPGEHLGFTDEVDEVEKESAVSKKLSEMTTRRVILLVLSIMLILPFFSPQLYMEDLSTSAQYGMDSLYRRLMEDAATYDLATSQPKTQEYNASKQRKIYEDDFIMYAYYHNWFCNADDIPDKKPSPRSSFGKLFWLGGAPPKAMLAQYFFPTERQKWDELVKQKDSTGQHSWDDRWNGQNWNYYQCNLPLEARKLLTTAWNSTSWCVKKQFRGISLASLDESWIGCPEDLRYQERLVVEPTALTDKESSSFRPLFVFDRRAGSRMEAWLNSLQTIFICFLLGVGAMTFSNDANQLVLMPIEKIIAKLDKIRSNPLEAMTIGDEEHHKEVMASKKRQVLDKDHLAMMKDLTSTRGKIKRFFFQFRGIFQRHQSKSREQQSSSEPMETVVLEKTIIKIGSLLALGFGEAGAEIIGQNMQGSDSSALNAMIPGRRVDALFGFCDIRNFTDATEVLQDQVMLFVNRIAGVVHSCINEFFGSPNKNIGDAFLLVWRLSGLTPQKQQRLADMALISFVKIIATINKSPVLAEYRSHPKLVKRLPNYRVRLGFGLHSGWAIEGAIGSEFKIDASYLSPNVNMAARLEACTKQYGCLVLISDALVKLCSDPVAHECRLIDHVAMVGGREAFKLFTMDLDDLALEIDRNDATHRAPSVRPAQYKAKHERQRKKNERWSEDFNMHSFFENDWDIITMRQKFTVEFFCRFNMAFLNYEAGNWTVAKSMFETTRFLLATEDGPSAALLRYMKQNAAPDGSAPKGWLGYRSLSEK